MRISRANPLSEDDRTHLKQMLELVPLTADHLCQGRSDRKPDRGRSIARGVSAESSDSGHKTRAILDRFEALASAMLDPGGEKTRQRRSSGSRSGGRASCSTARGKPARQTGCATKASRNGQSCGLPSASPRRSRMWARPGWNSRTPWTSRSTSSGKGGDPGPTNHAGFVDAVLARVAELSREGANEQAYGGRSRRPCAGRRRNRSRGGPRLLSSGTEQAHPCPGSPAGRPAFLVRKVELEDPRSRRAVRRAAGRLRRVVRAVAACRGAELRSRGRHWRSRGRVWRVAPLADERGAAANDLGTALQALGEREAGTERLEEAVAAYGRRAGGSRPRACDRYGGRRCSYNLASLSLAFRRKTGDAAHLAAAREHAEAARGVFAEAGEEYRLAQGGEHPCKDRGACRGALSPPPPPVS